VEPPRTPCTPRKQQKIMMENFFLSFTFSSILFYFYRCCYCITLCTSRQERKTQEKVVSIVSTITHTRRFLFSCLFTGTQSRSGKTYNRRKVSWKICLFKTMHRCMAATDKRAPVKVCAFDFPEKSYPCFSNIVFLFAHDACSRDRKVCSVYR